MATHSLVLVIVPEGCEFIFTKVANLLFPYQYEIDPHEEDCDCSYNAYRECELQMGLREKQNALKRIDGKSLWAQRKCEEVRGRLQYQYHKLFSQHPFYPNPDPHCEICRGKGKYTTTGNKRNGHIYYWNIGGIWNGWIFGPDYKPHANGEIKDNARLMKEITFDDNYKLGRDVITPDGKWTSMTEEILSLYQNCIAVAVDCRID